MKVKTQKSVVKPLPDTKGVVHNVQSHNAVMGRMKVPPRPSFKKK